MTPHLRSSRASLVVRAIAALAAAAFLAAGVVSASGVKLPSGDGEQRRVVRVTEEPDRKAKLRDLIEARERDAQEADRAPAPRSGGAADRRDEGAKAPEADGAPQADGAPEAEDAPEAPGAAEAPEAQPETIPESDGGASGDEGDG